MAAPVRTHTAEAWRFARVASAAVVALMVVASAWGLLVEDVYAAEETWAVASLRGNDLVTLLLVAPLLGVAVARAERWIGWELVWLGGLLYGVYNFAYYAFGAAFNDLFLLHVAAMSLSVMAAVTLAMSLDLTRIDPAVASGAGARVVAAYLTLVGLALYAAWGGLSLRFAFTGKLPEDVMPPTAVHLVYALDLGLLAPSFLVSGILLWRRRAWGVALGVAVNVFGGTYLVVLEFVGGFMAEEGIEGKTWVSPPAIGGALLCGAAAAYLLHRISATDAG